MHLLRQWYKTSPKWSCRLVTSLVIVTTAMLLPSCGRTALAPTLPPDEHAVQTRVAATLTALATAEEPTLVPLSTDTLVPLSDFAAFRYGGIFWWVIHYPLFGTEIEKFRLHAVKCLKDSQRKVAANEAKALKILFG